MIQRSSIVRTIRVTHRYLGLFFAPAILFFAFSGALQVFGLHQTSRGSSYVPARWIVEMAQIHKKQTLALPVPKGKKPVSDSGDSQNATVQKIPKAPGSKFFLQFFVCAMSFALAATTLLGIVMSLLYGGDRRVACAVVFFGVIFPVAVTLL